MGYRVYSTSYLLTKVGTELRNHPTMKREIAAYKKYDRLWLKWRDAPPTKEVDEKIAEIRKFCIDLLNRIAK